MDSRPPLYLLLGRLLTADECGEIVGGVSPDQWQRGTTFHGGGRNADICWLTDERWISRMTSAAQGAAKVLDLDIAPTGIQSLQLGRYQPGEDYGWHIDHDVSREVVVPDRKLSIVVSLTQGGGLDLDYVGRVTLNAGDAIAFSSLLRHQAPAMEYPRNTLVAWISGPRWR